MDTNDKELEDLVKKAQDQLAKAKIAIDQLTKPADRIKASQNELKKALTFVLKWEGEYSNDPNDPGGETKWGISKRSYPEEDIVNLTRDRALEIYANDYWLAAGCDLIPFPYNVAVFDTAVHCGVARAIRWFKEVKNVDVFLDKRKEYYIDLVNKNDNLVRFARGWWARLADLRKYVEINRKGDGCPG